MKWNLFLDLVSAAMAKQTLVVIVVVVDDDIVAIRRIVTVLTFEQWVNAQIFRV